jgi:hypothetical protein
VELPDGSYAALGWEVRSVQNSDGEARYLLGDTLLLVSTEGEVETLWSAFDHFEIRPSKLNSTEGLSAEEPWDWSHANGLDYDPETNAFFITVAGLDTVARIDGDTGAQTWSIGVQGQDMVDQSGIIQSPHSIQHLGSDRILLFNRNLPLDGEIPDGAEDCSEAIEFQLDLEQEEVETLWSYGSEECLWVVYLGEAQRLEGGNTQVIFSSAGQIDEATPGGDTVWRMNTDLGGAFGFGDRVSSFRLDLPLE